MILYYKIGITIKNIVANKNDSLKRKLKNNDYINLSLLTNNESIVNDMLTSTAWESARSTGIIAEFDFETTQKLTELYNLQEIIVDKSLANLVDFYFDNADKINELDSILLQLKLRFSELVGQEYLLKILYEEAIKELDEQT